MSRFLRPTTLDVLGPLWLRPALRWAANKWIRASVEEVKINRVFVPAEGDLVTRMRLSSSDMERLYNQEARYAFVGPDVMNEAEDVLRQSRMMSLGEVDFRLVGNRGIKLIGIELVLVPWMEGALLVPEWRKGHG